MTVQTRATLLSNINTRIPDNNVQAISAADVRETMVDVGDTAALRNSDNALIMPQATSPTHTEGLVFYNPTTHTLEVYNDISDVVLNVGSEFWVRVYNNTGSVIPNGTPCYVSGVTGGLENAVPAIGNTQDSAAVVGVATHDIPIAGEGFLTSHGRVNNVNTASFSVNDELWVSPTVAGAFVTTRPDADYFRTRIGRVVVSDALNGVIEVSIQRFQQETVALSYFIPMSGVTETQFFLAGTFQTLLTGQTGNSSFPVGLTGQRAFIHVNSITTGGDIVITGTSIDSTTLVPTAADTETITVDTTINQYYKTDKIWLEITNINVTGGTITGINYDAGIIGYYDGGGQQFSLGSYRADITTSSNISDLRLRFRKINDLGSKKFEFVILEDIGHDSTGGNGAIVDHIRTGADDRSYTFTVSLALSGDEITYQVTDFLSYFSGREYAFSGGGGDGLIVEFLGEPSGGLSAIDHATLHLGILI